jgi:hypothetical protein
MALLIWIICGLACYFIATGKNRSGLGWFCLGMLFGPFGILAAIVASKEPV